MAPLETSVTHPDRAVLVGKTPVRARLFYGGHAASLLPGPLQNLFTAPIPGQLSDPFGAPSSKYMPAF